MPKIQSLCVYCGSSLGSKADYAAEAKQLAVAMVERDMSLVYGGAHVGIMGAIADQMISLGGTTIGIIPEAIVELEVAHQGLTELLVVKDMHERKAKMAEMSDGFVALPGGLGTMEELFEVLTWSQLGFHAKPCGILNVAGFFDSLLQFLDTATAENFMRQAHRELLTDDVNPGALLDRMIATTVKTESKLAGQ